MAFRPDTRVSEARESLAVGAGDAEVGSEGGFEKEDMAAVDGADGGGVVSARAGAGATENTTVVRALLVGLRERGLDTEAAILVVLDGAKALHKAVKEVFGERALIQRCRVHKLRNVIEHLPKEKQHQAVWRLRSAWAKPTAEAALKELRATVKWLDVLSPGAARSLEEGLEETLTLHRLGINEALRSSFSSTNLIESCFARTEAWTRRVKRWRGAKMVLRWGAAALLVAEAGFRRVRGYAHLHELKAALQKHQKHSALEPLKPAA